jgi:hypothetical protein
MTIPTCVRWAAVRRGVRSQRDRGDSGPPVQNLERSEHAIRDLKDVFENATEPGCKASSIAVDGGWNRRSPARGILHGTSGDRKSLRHRSTEHYAGLGSSCQRLSIRFITSDLAFVDTMLTLKNVHGADGRVQPTVAVVIAFTAIRRGDRWSIQDERAHFFDPAPS